MSDFRMGISVFCTFRQAGFHKWSNAPEEYAYLRDLHRHEFHIRVDVAVVHNDRDIEFIHLKRMAHAEFVRLGSRSVGYDNQVIFGEKSCEQLAIELAEILVEGGLMVLSVEVSEDGENGARLTNE